MPSSVARSYHAQRVNIQGVLQLRRQACGGSVQFPQIGRCLVCDNLGQVVHTHVPVLRSDHK